MIPATTLGGKNVAVFGLGASGLATVASLQAAHVNVMAYDDNASSQTKARAKGINIVDLRGADWQQIDVLVLSPGVPLTHPEPHWTVELAQANGVEIIGDTEILVREMAQNSPQANLIAITGTNGKSTTTALLGHVLQQGGIGVQVGGNIGKPVLELDMPGADEAIVVEFSSYQIDLTPSLCPHVSILLNLSYDHIDRHGSMAGYADVKSRIFSGQKAGDVAVIGMDDDWTRGFVKMIREGVKLVPISTQPLSDGIFAQDGCLFETHEGVAVRVAELGSAMALKGTHNWQNAAAVFAAARALGVSAEAIGQGFLTFPGLAHRMERVGAVDNVVFINDSKATNADAAARALATFDTIYWIAGGLAKEGGIEELAPFFGKIKKAYLIGEAASQFAKTLSGGVEVRIVHTIDTAVSAAYLDAMRDGNENAVVLLAPACASFDQFANFELRGEAFRHAVAEIEGVNMKKVKNT